MCSIDDTGSDERDPLWVAFCRVPYRARSIRSIKADNKEKGKCEARTVRIVRHDFPPFARASACDAPRRMPDAIRASE
jgi:hypothetical protein